MQTKKIPLQVKLNKSGEFQRILEGLPQTCGVKSARVVLKAGEQVGLHDTKDREEVIVVLEGKGKFLYGKNRYFRISAGKVIYVPPNTHHNVLNDSNAALKYIYVVTPIK